MFGCRVGLPAPIAPRPFFSPRTRRDTLGQRSRAEAVVSFAERLMGQEAMARQLPKAAPALGLQIFCEQRRTEISNKGEH